MSYSWLNPGQTLDETSAASMRPHAFNVHANFQPKSPAWGAQPEGTNGKTDSTQRLADSRFASNWLSMPKQSVPMHPTATKPSTSRSFSSYDSSAHCDCATRHIVISNVPPGSEESVVNLVKHFGELMNEPSIQNNNSIFVSFFDDRSATHFAQYIAGPASNLHPEILVKHVQPDTEEALVLTIPWGVSVTQQELHAVMAQFGTIAHFQVDKTLPGGLSKVFVIYHNARDTARAASLPLTLRGFNIALQVIALPHSFLCKDRKNSGFGAHPQIATAPPSAVPGQSPLAQLHNMGGVVGQPLHSPQQTSQFPQYAFKPLMPLSSSAAQTQYPPSFYSMGQSRETPKEKVDSRHFFSSYPFQNEKTDIMRGSDASLSPPVAPIGTSDRHGRFSSVAGSSPNTLGSPGLLTTKSGVDSISSVETVSSNSSIFVHDLKEFDERETLESLRKFSISSRPEDVTGIEKQQPQPQPQQPQQQLDPASSTQHPALLQQRSTPSHHNGVQDSAVPLPLATGAPTASAAVKTAGSNNSGKDSTVINLHLIDQGVEKRTTVMVRNIPNKLEFDDFKNFVDQTNKNTYEFLYLRFDFCNRCNVGYAFISFTSPEHVKTFVQKRTGMKWNEHNYNSEKVIEIRFARIQGRDSLIQKFRNSPVMHQELAFRPRLYYTSGELAGEEKPFPATKH